MGRLVFDPYTLDSVLRRSMFLPALVVVAALLTPAPTPPAAAAGPVAASAPAARLDAALKVTIDSLTPSYLPEEGPIRVTGEVTNRTEVPWVGVNLYAVVGDAPMVGADELVEAAASEPTSLVGQRIITEGAFFRAGDLEAGESVFYSISVPRELIVDAGPGVYWFGVQALGDSSETPDDDISDGRARTFLPYLPPQTPGTVKTALVLPLRHYLNYADDGSLENLEHWQRTLSIGGRLRDLVDFAAAAGSTPVTWLVDPALPDAIRRIALGNPPRFLGPTEPLPGDDEPDPDDPGSTEDPDGDGSEGDDESSGTPSPTAEPAGPPEAEELTPEETAAAEAAKAWLARFEETVAGDQVLALPYGDLDVAAAAELVPRLYDAARQRPGAVLTDWGVTTTPAVAAPSGYLNPAGFAIAPADATVLATDEMFGDDPPGVAEVDGTTVAVTSSGATAGGPGPGDRHSSVQLRQRILSEAAVRLLNPGRHPLVVPMPLEWKPGDASAFVTGLDADWVDLTSVADATSRDGREVAPEELAYPESQQRRQLDAPVFDAVRGLITAGDTLQNLLTRNTEVAAAVTDQAFAGASYGARSVRQGARPDLLRSTDWIEDKLGAVEISAGPGVTLSGTDGGFATVITNDLDEPVKVNVVARSNGGVDIEPVEPIEIAANSRSTVVLDAHANRLGVTNVVLTLTDVDGNALGSTDQLPIRSAQVSAVIWLIIGTGLALLFLAILVRLVRRVRAGSRPLPATDDPSADPTDPTDPATDARRTSPADSTGAGLPGEPGIST